VKILQFGKFYPPSMGGTQQVMFEISEGVSKQGYTCDVLCSNTEAKYVEDKYDSEEFQSVSRDVFMIDADKSLVFK